MMCAAVKTLTGLAGTPEMFLLRHHKVEDASKVHKDLKRLKCVFTLSHYQKKTNTTCTMGTEQTDLPGLMPHPLVTTGEVRVTTAHGKELA